MHTTTRVVNSSAKGRTVSGKCCIIPNSNVSPIVNSSTRSCIVTCKNGIFTNIHVSVIVNNSTIGSLIIKKISIRLNIHASFVSDSSTTIRCYIFRKNSTAGNGYVSDIVINSSTTIRCYIFRKNSTVTNKNTAGVVNRCFFVSCKCYILPNAHTSKIFDRITIAHESSIFSDMHICPSFIEDSSARERIVTCKNNIFANIHVPAIIVNSSASIGAVS